MFSLAKLYVGGAALIAVLLGAWALLHAHDNRVRAAQQAAYTQAALDATTKAREEEQRRVAAQADINDETQRLANRARADAHAVDAAAPGLRDAFAAACFRAAPDHSTAVPSVAPAAAQPDMRSDVFGEVEARLRALAEEATERGNRGASCERQYDSLKP